MATTGVAALDELLGGLIAGDNVVWVSERDETYAAIETAFVAAAPAPTLVVAVSRTELRRAWPGTVEVIDASPGGRLARPGPLADELEHRFHDGRRWTILIDGLALLARRWGRDAALAFFVRSCPSMLQAGAITYWRIPRTLGAPFIDRVRQVTQCLLDVRDGRLRVVKAEGRPATVLDSVHHIAPEGGGPLTLSPNVAGGRLARGLAAARRDLGLTQAQLAAAAGVTPSAVSQAESGARGLSLDTLLTLSDRLGVSLDRLVSGTVSPGYQLARHDRRVRTDSRVTPLADDPALGLRAYFVTLDANERGVPPFAHKGTELVAIASGLVQVDVGEDTPVLRAGDSLLATTAPLSGWRNLRADPASFYWIVRD